MRFIPPGWKPGSTAGKDARRYTICAAQAAAYAAVETIKFEGAQFRRDIAVKAV